MKKKADFLTTICVCFGRPFAWRKTWARVWDEVKYCSDKCRGVAGDAVKGAVCRRSCASKALCVGFQLRGDHAPAGGEAHGFVFFGVFAGAVAGGDVVKRAAVVV